MPTYCIYHILIVKVKLGIVKAPLDMMGGGMLTLNLAFHNNKRLHWVLCSIESQWLNWSNYGKKTSGETSGPSGIGLKPPGGVWGRDDLRFIPISDLSTAFLACKGKGAASRNSRHRHLLTKQRKNTAIFASAVVALPWRRQLNKEEGKCSSPWWTTTETYSVNRHSSLSKCHAHISLFLLALLLRI